MHYSKMISGKWYKSKGIFGPSGTDGRRQLNKNGDMEDAKGNIQCYKYNLHWMYQYYDFVEVEDKMKLTVNQLVPGKRYHHPIFGVRIVNNNGDIVDEKGALQSTNKQKKFTYDGYFFEEIGSTAEIWLHGDKFVRATADVKINRIKTFGSIAVGNIFTYKNKVYRKVASANSVYGLSYDFILSEFGDSIEVE